MMRLIYYKIKILLHELLNLDRNTFQYVVLTLNSLHRYFMKCNVNSASFH